MTKPEALSTCPPFILIGEFGRAQGLKGEVRVKSYTQNPRDLATYGPLRDEKGREFVIESLRPASGGTSDILVAKIKGITTRNEAEALNRAQLFIARDRLKKPQDEDEFLAIDLIGLEAWTEDGTVIGTISNVPNYGGGDLLEIRPIRGQSLLLPFTKAFVPVIDLEKRHVIIILPVETGDEDDQDKS